jgi:hypothetical protein
MAIPSLDLMDQEQKNTFLELVLWHYKAIDGFWFLHVSDAFGQSSAESVVEEVWEDAARLASREIVRRFGIEEKGLTGFARAIALFPMAALVGYDISPEMHRRLFEAFAKEIDPAIRTECLFAPPDPHPADMFCKWRFTM